MSAPVVLLQLHEQVGKDLFEHPVSLGRHVDLSLVQNLSVKVLIVRDLGAILLEQHFLPDEEGV